MKQQCSCHKTRVRSQEELKKLSNRLSRIEGQVRGLREMLQKDVYCMDILVQVSAVNAAINSFSKELLGEHLRTCVAENLREGNDGAVDELVALQMARGALREIGSDVAVSATGIAGPTGAEPGKPVGTVWIGCATVKGGRAVCHHFDGGREAVRLQTVLAALAAIGEMLEP